MKKILFLAAAVTLMASCADESFIGDATPGTVEGVNDGSIQFGSGFKAMTRADQVGADAADLLGNKFYVHGVKGDGTGTGQTDVFKTYSVEWTANTAGTTASNTSDWEYVSKTHDFGSTTGITSQTIKYWDFSTTAYDFCAYSIGKGNTLISSGTPGDNQILATAISYANATTGAYTLTGNRNELAKCYITDMKTVAKANYQKEVELEFRSLASKIRMAIYETVPGYSVQNVQFYENDTDPLKVSGTGSGQLNNANATLFGADAFYSKGTYTVTFPNIGSAKAPGGTSPTSDYNKAHVGITGSAAVSTQSFSTLNYTSSKLGVTSTAATFAGTTPYYQTVLPNETGVVLEMRVNYDLVSEDGNTSDVIHIHGAKAFVPATYTKWMPNYAYTYIFKISDNTNGWTSTTTTDPAGLYPITFDAVVLNPIETTSEQTTITTVATPSITTYQKGHLFTDGPEYSASKGKVYAQVYLESADPKLRNDLDANSKLYTVAKGTGCAVEISEATVLDALNISGRNKLELTEVTSTAVSTSIEQIPGENGNPITVGAKTAAELTVSAGTYAFVYDTKTYSPLYLSESPAGFPTGYYTNATCTTEATGTWSSSTTYYAKDSYIYSAVVFTETDTSAPADWSGNYWDNPDGTGSAVDTYVAPATGKTKTYYRRYKVDHKVYGVKVIKVV
ncbi:MAG: hypothetical protein K6G70_07480 [Bacteroidaceae bacterium]|nr:hypothetical protein [Bacteroidaceae bacterium]